MLIHVTRCYCFFKTKVKLEKKIKSSWVSGTLPLHVHTTVLASSLKSSDVLLTSQSTSWNSLEVQLVSSKSVSETERRKRNPTMRTWRSYGLDEILQLLHAIVGSYGLLSPFAKSFNGSTASPCHLPTQGMAALRPQRRAHEWHNRSGPSKRKP